jgi:hypothetical protein
MHFASPNWDEEVTCCVTYTTGFGLDYWIEWHLIHTTVECRKLQSTQ